MELAEETPAPSTAPEDEKSTDALDIIIVLARGRRLIAFVTLGALILGAIISLLLRPTFTANAIILPPQQQQSSLTAMMGQLGSLAALGGGGGASALGLKSPADMYVGILQSRTIADQLIDKFHLQTEYGARKMEDTRKVLKSHVTIEAAKDGLIHIDVKDHDPRRASDLANGYVDALYKINSTLAITEAAQRRVFFDEQLAEEKTALTNAEDDLRATEQKTGLIQLSGQAQMIIQSIAQMRAQIASREVQVQALRTFATDQNPDVNRLQEEIATLRQQLAKLENDQQHLSPGDVQVPAGRVPEESLEYARKLREVKYHETLFDLLSRQYEAARIDEAKSAPIIQVIDRAVPPDKKSGPHGSLITLGLGVLGFLGACIWLFLNREYSQLSAHPEYGVRLRELRSQFRSH